MRIIKNLLLSLIGIIAVFTVILAFILSSYNNQDYKQLLIDTVDNLTDHTLSIKGSFELNRSFTPVLSASEIELHSKSDNSYVHIDNFRIQITLAPLFSKTLLINDLLLENMRVAIQNSEETKGYANLFSYLPMPIIEHAKLKNVQLISESDNQIHTLDSLLITAKDRQAPLELHGTGMFRGHVFEIEGQLGPLADISAQQKPYPLNLTANWKQVQLFINGTIADPAHGDGLDLVSKINVPELADVFVAKTPVKGHLQGRAHIKGDFAEPVLAEIQAVLVDKQSIDLQVTGSIGNLLTREQTELHLSGFIHDAQLIKWIMPDNAPSFNSLNIDTDISKVSTDYALQNINIKLSDSQGLKLNWVGSTHIVLEKQPFRNLDIQASISSQDTQTVKPYLGNILPEMGPVKATGRITTQSKGFVLSDLDLLIGVNKNVQLKAKGRVGYQSLDPESDADEIALELVLKAKHSSELTSLLDIEHPEIGPVSIDALLGGSTDQLTLGDIKLLAGDPDVFTIQANGRMSWDRLDTDSPEQLVDFTIQSHTPSIQNASRLYGQYSPDLGPAKASMRIHGKGDVLEGNDLVMQIGTESSLLFTLQGKIAQMFYADLFFKGIQLTGTLTGKSTSHLSKLLENSKIPDIGPLSGKFMILGDTNSLQIPQITLSAGRKTQLMLAASGKISELPLRKQVPPRGVDIDLTVTAPSSADLSVLVGNEIPDFGSLSIKGLLTGSNGILSIDHLKLTAGDPAQPDISMSGTVKNVLSRNGVQMNVLFNEKTLLKLFDLKPIPELGSLTGSAVLSNAGGSFGIQDLKLELGESELIDLKIIGAIEDVANTNQISANVNISIKQPDLLGKLFVTDLSGLGPVSITGLVSGNKSKVTFKGNSIVGRTRFSNDLTVSFINDKPEISGTINSPNLFLQDFGMNSKVPAAKKTAKKQATKPVKTMIFNETPIPLQALHKVDLKLQLRIFKISDSDYKLDKVNIDLLLQGGKLIVNPVSFAFSEGQVSMNAVIDAKTNPEWSLNINGDNIQLAELFGQHDSSPPLSGKLNLAVDLTATGISEHEIVAHLNGELGLTLENGGMNRSKLELVFLNPLGWLFSYGINKNEIEISCGLARYQIQQGIIKSKVFLIDGPKFLTRGQTEVNLVNETINSLFHLQKKNILKKTILPTLFESDVAIKVTGNLANPTFKEAPLTSLGANAGRYIFSPVAEVPREILGTVFDIFDAHKEVQSPCKAYLEKVM